MSDETRTTENPVDELPDAVKAAKESGEVVFKLTGEDGKPLYFKKPGKQDINRFLATTAKGKVAPAIQNLVFDLLIHPSEADLKAMFNEKPGRIVAINQAIQTEIGLNEDIAVKKL